MKKRIKILIISEQKNELIDYVKLIKHINSML